IYIDGVRANNVQSGQVDLGMVGLEHYGKAVVDYTQNSISFLSAEPVFLEDRIVAGDFRLSGGSFGTALPYARMDFKLGDRIVLGANMSGIYSKGDYLRPDNTPLENNDLRQMRAGLDLKGNTNQGFWKAKAYYNLARRGTPGSLSWPSTDRQGDMNGFIQGLVSQQLGKVYRLNASVKYALDKLDYFSTWGDSNYRQDEVQVNTSHQFRIFDWWSASIAADFQWDGVESNLYKASRSGIFTAISTSFVLDIFRADIAVEYNGVFDKDAGHKYAVSPSLGLKVTAFRGFDIVLSGRRSYRVPTFNEMFYPGYGNTELKPEDAWMTDLGISYRLSSPGGRYSLKAKANGFYNYLTDKIISAPSADNPYVWLPYNIGKVQSAGIDLGAGFGFKSGDLSINVDADYSWQQATDKTPDSSTFGQQIPYVALHSGRISASGDWRGWFITALWNIRSGRYDSNGQLPDWNTVDMSFGKSVSIPHCGPLTLKLTLRNLTDQYYEVVRDYPMPGIGFYGGVEFKF
ncbi:MAG: outer membrane beta-barrel protein, partial [Candidatus Cryptobacteroides sp.]